MPGFTRIGGGVVCSACWASTDVAQAAREKRAVKFQVMFFIKALCRAQLCQISDDWESPFCRFFLHALNAGQALHRILNSEYQARYRPARSGYLGFFACTGGFLRSDFMTSVTALSSSGSSPLHMREGSSMTVMSGSTPWPSMIHSPLVL